MRFEDFVLQLDASSRGGFRAKVLKSPFGEGGVGFSLPPLTDMAALDVLGPSRDIGHPDTAAANGGRPPLEVGTELYRSVFQGQVRSLLDKSRGQVELSSSLGLRLKIKIDPNDEEAVALADLPWELLCDGEMEDFFALSRQMSLVRYLDVPRSSQPIPFAPPLRILAVGASPRTMQPLDLKEEERYLEELSRGGSGIEVRFVPNASAGAVREALAGDTYNVLHFMGHGTFDRASGEGMLAFEGSNGLPELVSGRAFATKLKDLRSLGVVMLNACNTARAGHQDGANPFRGVATALVLGGVPAVVAMQRPITDRAAISFSTAFYRHLARGDSVDEALTEGRQSIHSARPEGFEWATPVLFLRIPDGNVFVAKPAERPVEPPPAPPAMTDPIVAPAPVPVSPKRGAGTKIAVGVAGTGLVAFVLYTAIPKMSSPPEAGNKDFQMTTDVPVQPSEEKKKDEPVRRNTTRDHQVTGKGSVPPKEEASRPVPAPSGGQPGTSTPSGGVPEAPAQAADLSSLKARLVSIARQEAGMKVTVSFTNTGDRSLSAVLSTESTVLNDGGRQYSVIDSDLLSQGNDLLLQLAPGKSSSHTFEFQAPELGSQKFLFSLVTADGHRLISNATVPVAP